MRELLAHSQRREQRRDKMKAIILLSGALGAVFYSLILIVGSGYANSLTEGDIGGRIQAKAARVVAIATKLGDSGADISSIRQTMEQVNKLLQSGKPHDAEKVLDALLIKLGTAQAVSAREEVRVCDPRQPMSVSNSVTLDEDCTIGGDLTVTGNGVLHFDYGARKGRHLIVRGNVIVQDSATLWVQGSLDERAIFEIENEFSQQHSMASRNEAKVKLDRVELRTHASGHGGKGSISMNYDAHDRSLFEVSGSMLVEEQSWLLANLHDSAKLTMTDTQHVPDEIYLNDSSSATISGPDTRTGIWLDAAGVKGTLKLPDMHGPFSWRIGGGALNTRWSLVIQQALPGIGVEIKPDTELTIIGNGARAPVTGELKIAYFVIGKQAAIDGLKAGLQNHKLINRLTLQDVQLGPIAWQIYAGDDADVTIKDSTINEIGIFGRNAKVHVEQSVLQLAALAALGPGSLLDIHDCDIWNQAIEAANDGNVSISDSKIHGTLFHTQDSRSSISIRGGRFYPNAPACSQAAMVDIATGQPKCNPFSAAGMPRSAGVGKIVCTDTAGCRWGQVDGEIENYSGASLRRSRTGS
jgi:hypothetical protein